MSVVGSLGSLELRHAKEKAPGESSGLLQYLAVRRDPHSDDKALNRALAKFLLRIRSWATPFLRARFWQGGLWRTSDAFDLTQDAIQHLVIAVAQGKADSLAGANEAVAVAWCKRVLENVVLSEFRRHSQKSYLSPFKACPKSAETAIDARESLQRLLVALRREVLAADAKNATLRLALLDEFVGSLLDAHSRMQVLNRAHQRRSRGRRVAREAWQSLRGRDARSLEFVDVAAALRLDVVAGP